eukprot:GHVQ01014656.1.p2 GENE.GHVQ01014656.1~~GHVQ01014656.1.p2  ORF type:complete len:362 (+),score=33.23 GHVQ01014656.1:406-1491(+)
MADATTDELSSSALLSYRRVAVSPPCRSLSKLVLSKQSVCSRYSHLASHVRRFSRLVILLVGCLLLYRGLPTHLSSKYSAVPLPLLCSAYVYFLPELRPISVIEQHDFFFADSKHSRLSAETASQSNRHVSGIFESTPAWEATIQPTVTAVSSDKLSAPRRTDDKDTDPVSFQDAIPSSSVESIPSEFTSEFRESHLLSDRRRQNKAALLTVLLTPADFPTPTLCSLPYLVSSPYPEGPCDLFGLESGGYIDISLQLDPSELYHNAIPGRYPIYDNAPVVNRELQGIQNTNPYEENRTNSNRKYFVGHQATAFEQGTGTLSDSGRSLNNTYVLLFNYSQWVGLETGYLFICEPVLGLPVDQ